MSHQKVTSKGWFSRIGSSIKGVFIGIVMFLFAFPFLFLNEGCAVKTAKGLAEGKGAVVSIQSTAVDPSKDGMLVHMTGPVTTTETLADPVFNVSLSAIAIKRTVSMYQWEEKSSSTTRTKLGGGEETVTTYTYNKVWSTRVINSSSFDEPAGRTNPADKRYPDWEARVTTAKIGAYDLSPSLIQSIGNFQEMPVNDAIYQSLPEAMRQEMQLEGTGFYVGLNPAAPEVGDLRITFSVAMPAVSTVIAKQTGTTFEAYKATTGTSINWLKAGTHSAESMFEAAEAANVTRTWIFRFVGFFLMFIGLGRVFAPAGVLADVLPIAGRLMRMGTNLIAGAISVFFSLLTIGVAWIFYRPVLGIILIVVGLGIFGAIFMVANKRKAGAAPAPTGTI